MEVGAGLSSEFDAMGAILFRIATQGTFWSDLATYKCIDNQGARMNWACVDNDSVECHSLVAEPICYWL